MESSFKRSAKGGKKMQAGSDYDYVMSIGDKLGQYEGKWIVVHDNEILYAGEDLAEIYNKFKEKHPDKNPFVMKISKEPNMLL